MLEARLWVSSANANDTDFTLKLTDVHPDGRSRLIQDGIQRMRWRDGVDQTEPKLMDPGTVYPISISLWNTSYVFPTGHRIRLIVASANAPRFRPNPNTGQLVASEDGRTVVAQNTVHFSRERPSAIYLPVVALADLPQRPILDAVADMQDSIVADATRAGVPANAARSLLARLTGVE